MPRLSLSRVARYLTFQHEVRFMLQIIQVGNRTHAAVLLVSWLESASVSMQQHIHLLNIHSNQWGQLITVQFKKIEVPCYCCCLTAKIGKLFLFIYFLFSIFFVNCDCYISQSRPLFSQKCEFISYNCKFTSFAFWHCLTKFCILYGLVYNLTREKNQDCEM